MIDIETVGTGPNACILTIAAQTFDPFSIGYQKQDYYARVDVDSQPDREVDDATVEWWATQPQQAQRPPHHNHHHRAHLTPNPQRQDTH